MKGIQYLILLLAVTVSCTKIKDGDISFVETAAPPSDGDITFAITNDNSGKVTITPGGSGAVSYDVYFGDATTAPASVMPGKNITHVYAEGNYTVKVAAKNIGGKATETTKQLSLVFRAPENVVITTTTNAHDITVSAAASYAPGGFKVSFGDVANEVPVTLAAGANATHTYTNAGVYTVKVQALSGGAATTIATKQITIYDPLTLPMTFELATVSYAWGDFGGSGTAVIPNPFRTGINTSATVGRIVKNAGETWAGNFIIMSAPIDFTTNKKFKVKVYSTRVGLKVTLQLERSGDNTFKEAKEIATTVANAWEELTFDFNGVILDNSKKLQNILFFLDNGTKGDGSANYTILFDDIILTN
ncbi:hypothetical protein GFS24_07620 [Chitinophaga sp. SYP-B3965]|uniref:hypothetical protein n=1 Tax=Chitinophaga sp. SYP-B3965 TaxID=2663120 RepID=UPI001299632F|nr:hypothetical protein [Chitinophaga sp. SYP-B3965]MRG44977.1 hypothetical protein [Chitinophaga sp. SYP-B3965]